MNGASLPLAPPLTAMPRIELVLTVAVAVLWQSTNNSITE